MEILNLSYTTRKNKYVQLTHDNICTIYFKFKENFFFFLFTHTYAMIALQSMANVTFATIAAVRIDALVPFAIHCGAFVDIWKR